tara:strand:+ start:99 stop:533 length:435 start_codon:yes stop_codon:yes gene_type:complete
MDNYVMIPTEKLMLTDEPYGSLFTNRGPLDAEEIAPFFDGVRATSRHWFEVVGCLVPTVYVRYDTHFARIDALEQQLVVVSGMEDEMTMIERNRFVRIFDKFRDVFKMMGSSFHSPEYLCEFYHRIPQRIGETYRAMIMGEEEW